MAVHDDGTRSGKLRVPRDDAFILSSQTDVANNAFPFDRQRCSLGSAPTDCPRGPKDVRANPRARTMIGPSA